MGENSYLYRSNQMVHFNMRFIGNIEAKTDAKGRAFLPANFRKELQAHSEECLYMRKDIFQNCLVLYPESIWNQQLDQLRKRLNRYNAQHQMLFRQFVADVELITLDSSGRLLIPKRMQKMAGISQSIRFIGMDDTIEIWAQEQTEQPFMEPELFAAGLEAIMGMNELEQGGL